MCLYILVCTSGFRRVFAKRVFDKPSSSEIRPSGHEKLAKMLTAEDQKAFLNCRANPDLSRCNSATQPSFYSTLSDRGPITETKGAKNLSHHHSVDLRRSCEPPPNLRQLDSDCADTVSTLDNLADCRRTCVTE